MAYSRLQHCYEGMVHDVRYALRLLNKQRNFVVMTAVTFALGIGASASIFSVARGVFLHAVELPRPEELFYVYNDLLPRYTFGLFYPEDALWLRRECNTFPRLALTSSFDAVVSGWGEPFRVDGLRVSGEYFETLGAPLEIGRYIRLDDDVSGAEPVLVLAHHIWTAHFGADPGVVGRHIELNGTSYKIIGVAGRQLSSLGRRGFESGFWVPLAMGARDLNEHPMPFLLIGRLAPGATIEAARAELKGLGIRRGREVPDRVGFTFSPVSVIAMRLGETPKNLRTLALAVGLLLLIACINVSGLLLTRVTTRRAEVSLHVMMGASRVRLYRLIFFEALILSLLGAGIGIGLAFAAVKSIFAMASTILPELEGFRLDGLVLVFALAAAFLSAILSGVVPAAITLRSGAVMNPTVQNSTHSGIHRAGTLFVAAQFAAGLILLTCSGLLLNNFIRLMRMPLVFNPGSLTVMEVSIPWGSHAQDAAFGDEVLRRLRLLHGVRDVALAEPGITQAGLHVQLRAPGQPKPESGRLLTPWTNVSPGFFRVMGIPVLAGREFTESDAKMQIPPIIINEAVARYVWPNQSAIGMELLMPDEKREWQPSRIVGVVRTAPIYGAHYYRPDRMRMQIYSPLARKPDLMQFLIRTTEAPAAMEHSLRQVVRDIEPRQPVERISRLEERISDQVVPDRFYTCLLLSFSVTAITIACAGLHGLLNYLVASRRHEIGVRIAVGATAGDLIALLGGFGLRAALGGIAIGVVASWMATRLIRSQLYVVKTNDAFTFVGAVLILVVVSLLTCIAPVRRMLKVDPATALRYE